MQLSQTLLGQPVLSLRSGTPVAVITTALINPNNLHIDGFYCQDNANRETLILLPQDVRDVIPQGIVINDHDVLAEPNDLVRLAPIIRLQFELIGQRVVDTTGRYIGRVNDYAIDIASLYIQRIYVTQSIIRNFSGGSLGIERTQIVEITPKKIVVSELLNKMPVGAKAIA